jgi:hypothetical protein
MLGPALVALSFADRARRRWTATLAVYGRVPLFFYVTHLFVIHAIAVLLAMTQGGEPMRIQVVNNPRAIPSWYGLSLPAVYLVWAAVVMILFFPCRKMAALKNTRQGWWLRYL